MKEKIIKERKWVIKAAVVFFVVLLLLTFFSNTIMNYSLPQVTTQYVQSGTIASKVRGTGVVAADNPYNVTVNSERKVKLVAVKEGDSVEQGALLVMFEDGDSTEFSTAKKTLDDAKATYQRYIVTNQIENNLVQRVESGQTSDYSGYQTQLALVKAEVDSAKQTVDQYTASTKALQTQLDTLQNAIADTTAEQAALNAANAALKAAENDKTMAENNAASLEEQYNLYSEAGSDVSSIAIQLANAKSILTEAQNTVLRLQQEAESAQEALTAKQENAQNRAAIASLQTQLNAENAVLSDASDKLAKAQETQQKIVEKLNTETELASMYQTIQEAQTAFDQIGTDGSGNKLIAAQAGIVSNLSVSKGQTTVAGEPLMTITNTDGGYAATITVTTEQSRRIKIGDTADIDENWYYSNLSAVVTAIRSNSENPGQSKLVDIKIDGDVAEGTSLNFAIGERNSSYNLIVPNGAVREDKNGKFILIIRQKSSPLGNRYFAKRVDVEIAASDDVNSAVTGELEGYEYVITTSTKSIKAGNQVRLTES
ncbi:MAG: HlyD family efflux transporter periplasmic adaptor subunit [Lachnospiraceae bacterium]|nr:HlyD family efflux transporter periplasmic adaptor subunit [Lachnospiraceae bacterium]